MEKEIVIFIISFVIPHLYYRALFFIANKIFHKTYLREKTGLKIHHPHYGAIIALLATIILLFSNKNIYVIILLGLGLGLIYDEFIPALFMKSNRKDELIVYEKAFIKTLIMFIIISLIILFLSFVL